MSSIFFFLASFGEFILFICGCKFLDTANSKSAVSTRFVYLLCRLWWCKSMLNANFLILAFFVGTIQRSQAKMLSFLL